MLLLLLLKAFVKAINPEPKTTTDSTVVQLSGANKSCPSPGRSADIRMKNLQQLKYMQQLLDDNILTKTEFLEQKRKILEALNEL